ncbi:MAG: LVIVD repeat-containing protein [Bacteroidia bacterium]
MKPKQFLLVLAVLAAGIFTTSCIQDSCNSTKLYRLYTPVYETMSNVRQMVGVEGPRALETPGKIYVYGKYLFINEKGQGIHIVNIENKANPANEAFIKIPGNIDMAVKGSYLYADNFIDLVVFDLSNLNNIQEVGRELSVFPENVSVHERAGSWLVDKSQGVAIDWEVEEIEVDCNQSGSSLVRGNVLMADDVSTLSSGGGSGQNESTGSGAGTGGSMARFTIMSGNLYVIDEAGSMHLFDLATPNDPSKIGDIDIAWNIETIFPYTRGNEQYLFIGAQDGMYIYDNNNPTAPTQISKFVHVSSCDPVVAEDSMAFVTLRNGTECEGYTNELQLIDIRNLNVPSLIETYNMYNPHGLGVDNGLLFICDADEGLKIYDLRETTENVDKNLIKQFDGLFAYDVIPYNGTLLLSSADGMYLIDYSNVNDIKIVSKLSTALQ